MHMNMTIAAKDVREGDYLYNSHAYHPSAAWVRVTHIESLESGNLLIGTTVWYTVLNREEGITVKREGKPCGNYPNRQTTGATDNVQRMEQSRDLDR